jgi:hypothetical protein
MVERNELDLFEKKILDRVVRGMHLKEIARELPELGEKLGPAEKRLRTHVMKGIYNKLGVTNLHGAAAEYANRLGLQGQVIGATSEEEEEPEVFYRQGVRHAPACLISSAIRLPQDLDCTLSGDRYSAPTEFVERLEDLKEEVKQRAGNAGRVVYQRAGDNLLLVSRLETDDEFYCPLRLTLQRTGYLTYLAIRENLTSKLRFSVNPRKPAATTLPLPIGVNLHVIAGDPPQLILLRRGWHVGSYGGYITSAIAGWGEADNDLAEVTGAKYFDFIAAMTREGGRNGT